MNFEKIEEIIAKEKKFRQDQIRQAIFRDLIGDWAEVTTLPMQLREELGKSCSLEIKAEIFRSKDGHSAKTLIELEDGLKIEAVLMRHQGRNTVCVSSQVGCPLGCSFCATGKAGFKRNLTSGEIIEQVLFFARYLKKDDEKVHPVKSGLAGPGGNREFNRVDNIVFMGMGEPFLNYDNVFAAIKMINDAKGLAIGSRHISISTVGIVEGIEKMSQEPLQINLAISLHAPDDKLRSEIMPINKKYPIEKVLKAVDKYIKKTRRKVMVEYIMIKGVNDSFQHAKELAVLMKRPLVFVNLIAYNPTGVFEPTQSSDIKKFKDVLMKAGIQAIERYRFGGDVEAACGQLVGGKNH